MMERLLCPFRAFLCHGVCGVNGEERVVRTYQIHEMAKYHDLATKYDDMTGTCNN